MISSELSPQRLESPDSPTGVYEKRMTEFRPIQHPQVTKMMIELHPPSPVKLAKDLEQPVEGIIETKKRERKYSIEFSLQNLMTPVQREVSLSLGCNSLLLKRANRAKSNSNLMC